MTRPSDRYRFLNLHAALGIAGVLFASFALGAVIVFRADDQASAHLTDPAHDNFTMGFYQSKEYTVMPEGSVYVPFMSAFDWTEYFDTYYVAYRQEFDITVPQGLSIDSIAFDDDRITCAPTQDSLTWHCGMSEDRALSIVYPWREPFRDNRGGVHLITNAAPGDYQVSIVGKMKYWDYTSDPKVDEPQVIVDQDVATLHVVVPHNAELEWTKVPDKDYNLSQNGEVKLTYVVKNTGSESARDVTGIFYAKLKKSFASLTALFAEDALCTLGNELASGTCTWTEIAAGESKKVYLTVSAASAMAPQDEEVRSIKLSAALSSFDLAEGDVLDERDIDVVCRSYVSSTSLVYPKAEVANVGCTWVGENVKVSDKAVLGKAAWVQDGSMVGIGATMGQFSILNGRLFGDASLGERSQIYGNVFEGAKIGDDVNLTAAARVTVGAAAVVGDGTTLDLSAPESLSVNILQGAKVPANTVITDGYCSANPEICEIQ